MIEPASRNEGHRYARYTPLCLAGLRRALDPTCHLYRRQLRNGVWERTWDTEELTSTAICLIGISRAGFEQSRLGLDAQRALRAAIHAVPRHRYPGALGLLVWASAVSDGPPLDELLGESRLDLDDDAANVARLTSMEAAWLLSGLLHEHARNPQPRMLQLVKAVLRELEARYWRNPGGLMPHAGTRAPLNHRLRSHIANFADQIYAVQALAFAALVLESRPALEQARHLAARLLELQGPLGQWWWHYDARNGELAERFPVYSVHQHAMAPMALMALEAAGGGRFGAAIAASHDWLAKNELGVDLVDEEAGTIWRNIEPDDGRSKLRHLRSLLGRYPRGPRDQQPALRLNRETRPYEWAWCLYAGAIANGNTAKGHIV
jgi:hypothetical protein